MRSVGGPRNSRVFLLGNDRLRCRRNVDPEPERRLDREGSRGPMQRAHDDQQLHGVASGRPGIGPRRRLEELGVSPSARGNETLHRRQEELDRPLASGKHRTQRTGTTVALCGCSRRKMTGWPPLRAHPGRSTRDQ